MITKNASLAIMEAGGYKPVAEHFGISWQAVQKWARTRVPAERVPALAKLSGVPAKDIRPDVFGQI